MSTQNDTRFVSRLTRETLALTLAIQRYLARSEASPMMLQIEDLLLQQAQVNVPGTVDEHPNWRIKWSVNLEDWRCGLDLERIARSINRERSA